MNDQLKNEPVYRVVAPLLVSWPGGGVCRVYVEGLESLGLHDEITFVSQRVRACQALHLYKGHALGLDSCARLDGEPSLPIDDVQGDTVEAVVQNFFDRLSLPSGKVRRARDIGDGFLFNPSVREDGQPGPRSYYTWGRGAVWSSPRCGAADMLSYGFEQGELVDDGDGRLIHGGSQLGYVCEQVRPGEWYVRVYDMDAGSSCMLEEREALAFFVKGESFQKVHADVRIRMARLAREKGFEVSKVLLHWHWPSDQNPA